MADASAQSGASAPIIGTILSGEPRVRVALDDGREFGSEFDAARALIADGVAPETQFVTRWYHGVDCMSASVGWFAERIVDEGDSGTRFGWWAPHPRGEYPDALVRWHRETASARAEAREVAAKARKAKKAASTNLVGEPV